MGSSVDQCMTVLKGLLLHLPILWFSFSQFPQWHATSKHPSLLIGTVYHVYSLVLPSTLGDTYLHQHNICHSISLKIVIECLSSTISYLITYVLLMLCVCISRYMFIFVGKHLSILKVYEFPNTYDWMHKNLKWFSK